ncbi:hypothetical protein [Streptomyces griseoaurantiacus]|uniref:hypothetical protein n=1 Tax=Streptomyces griseoaurantiacus TaxID=68213 RepID=UPI0036CC5454
MTEQKKTRIQGIGWVPAAEAQELEPGDLVMWNGGPTSIVTKIEEASPCFLRVHFKSTETGEEETPRRWKKTAMVARVLTAAGAKVSEEYGEPPPPAEQAPTRPAVDEWCTGCNTDHNPDECNYRPQEPTPPTAPARGEEDGSVKVRFGLSNETRARLRESGDHARAEFRAEMDAREAAEARAHGVPVRKAVQARIDAREQEAGSQ